MIKRHVKYSANSFSNAIAVQALFTEQGVLISHLRFLYLNRRKSQSWQERSVFAIELLLKFILYKANDVLSGTALLQAFVDAICFGTLDSNNEDASGLFWQPRSSNDVIFLLSLVNRYCDYLDSQHGTELPKLNPLRKTTYAEEKLLWCAYYKRASNAFLNHLHKPSKFQFAKTRIVESPSRELLAMESVYRFRESNFENFLVNGFLTKTGEPDYGSQLIVFLMHFGGLRLSECFHIYTSDISIDRKTGNALVRVYHPSSGKSPEAAFSTRREYLNVKYGLKPRNEYLKSHRLYAGWKNPLLTNRDLSFNVFFYPVSAANQFTQLLHLYLTQRSKVNHPYLLSISDGRPESKKNFIKKYQNALNRVGLAIGKHVGGSPHSHRHSFGYRLADAGYSQVEISKAMHHRSPDSCRVYTIPQDSEIRGKLREVHS
ncbi:gamma-mobile-trio recombinase GmtY [Rheinheimera sp.]|uniref:gamma-mobile-trio recombinase GmtY n=1 Tax=Rheinheimera sp. TaxID=1869214 RepID=UPI0037C9959F